MFKDAVAYKILLRVSWMLLYWYYRSINYGVVHPPTPFGNSLVLIVAAKL